MPARVAPNAGRGSWSTALQPALRQASSREHRAPHNVPAHPGDNPSDNAGLRTLAMDVVDPQLRARSRCGSAPIVVGGLAYNPTAIR